MIIYKGKALYFGAIDGLSTGLKASDVGCPAEYNLADHVITLTQTMSLEALDGLRDALAAGRYGSGSAKEVQATEVHGTSSTRSKPTSGRAAGFWTQLQVLTKREAAYVYRDTAGLIASIVAPLLLNGVFACLFEGVGKTGRDDYNIQGHFGAVTQVFIGGMFGSAQPLLLRFPTDRGIFLREYATSTYGAAPYFLSKTCVELPQAFLNSVLVMIAYYWITGLSGSWIIHVGTFWMSGVAAGSTALLVGCLASNAEVAQQSAPGIFVLQLLFAGVFLPVTQIPSALRCLQWLASLKYAINLDVLNEFGETNQERNNWSPELKRQADALIASTDIDPDLWWFYLLMIIVLFCVFRALSILALARRAAAFF